MARATVTIRELKNKDTGIDLSVTSFKETKGRLASTYEYQVMVVTNLTYFKTAKHREVDNVQFTFLRKLSDFEEIYTKFNTKYSGTAFPQLPKKVLMMNNVIAKERRNNIDHFVRYLASVPKFCTDSILLEFLGVSALKAGKLKKMEVSESIVNKQDKGTVDCEAELADTGKKDDDDDDDNLFEDDDITVDDDDTDLFTAEDAPSDSKDSLKMFDEPDLSGELEEGEDDDLFITRSRSEVVSITREDFEEGTEDLFSADDDLDEIMKMKISTEADKPDVTEDSVIEPELNEGEPETKTHEVQSEPPKEIVPKPKARPPIPKRRDRTLSNETKTDISTNQLDSDMTLDIKVNISKDKVKPPLMNKPIIASKPVLKPKPGVKPKPVPASRKPDVINSVGKGKDTEATSADENITEDDIMKYIQDNTGDSADLDLFS